MPLLISSAKYSAVRHASAQIVSVGFLSGLLTNGAASATNRFFASCAWQYWLSTDLDGSLPKRGYEQFAAIISGIPLLNHPADKRSALVEAAFRRLQPGGPMVQFSYGLFAPVKPPRGISVRRAAYVWANLPPASVWVYRKRG